MDDKKDVSAPEAEGRTGTCDSRLLVREGTLHDAHARARAHDTCSAEGRIKMTQCEYIGGGEERQAWEDG